MKKVVTQDQADMKLANLITIFDILYNKSPISRADLAKISGMSPTSITRLITPILQKNLIIETPSSVKKVGRTAILLEINKDAFYSVGINIDSKFLHVSILDFSKTVISDKYIKLSSLHPTIEEIVNRAYLLYEESLDFLKLSPDKIIGVGISVIGVMKDAEYLAFIPQFQWEGINLRSVFQKRFSMQNVIIDNDCNAAVLGECVKHPEYKHKAVACIALGSGVGSSFCLNGNLFFQNEKAALSEIGHTIVDPNGILCDCGNVGCLQTFIAEEALIQRAKKFEPTLSTLEELHIAWLQQIPWAVKIIQDACTYTKVAVNNISCVYNPDIVLIGGDSIDTYWDMFKSIVDHDQLLFRPLKGSVAIIPFFKKYQSSILGISQQVQTAYLNTIFKEIVS